MLRLGTRASTDLQVAPILGNLGCSSQGGKIRDKLSNSLTAGLRHRLPFAFLFFHIDNGTPVLDPKDLLDLVRFLLPSVSTESFHSPPPAATEKLLLNLQELLSEQNLPLPDNIVSLHFYPELVAHQSHWQSQASSKFLSNLSSFSASELQVLPNLHLVGPVHPLQDVISHLLTPPETTPEPSQSPDITQSWPLTRVTPALFSPEPSQSPDIARPECGHLIICLPARQPLSPSLSFSENRNICHHLDLDLESEDSFPWAPQHPETREKDSSGAACSTQRRPHLHLRPSKSGTRSQQGGAPAPGKGKNATKEGFVPLHALWLLNREICFSQIARKNFGRESKKEKQGGFCKLCICSVTQSLSQKVSFSLPDQSCFFWLWGLPVKASWQQERRILHLKSLLLCKEKLMR